VHQPKYALFYDNHTMPHCPDVGKGFDVEHFTDRIKACGVDYLTFHARCNLGMAYYDTSIGTKHPSLEYDLFGRLADACQRKDIALTAYLNAGISSAEGVAHPEWVRLPFDGHAYPEERMTPYVRTMCFNSGYRQHLVSMVDEIARKYPVAGFFIDCIGSPDCVCPICIREMKERSIDWRDKQAVREFGKLASKRLAIDIAQAVKKINPEYLLYFNGLGYEEQFGIGTYLECECLPASPGWGYDFLPLAARHMRTIADQPLLNMTARFYEWGDFGGLRAAEGIKSELLTGLSLGLRPNVGSHFHPRGDFEDPVLDRVEEVYRYLREREAWYDGARPRAEIAVVFVKDHTHFGAKKYLRSAARLLGELQQQFDVVTEFADWGKYELLVLPDEITLGDKAAQRIKAHLENGKAVISSGHSGLDPARRRFALEEQWGVRYEGECDLDPAYFRANKTFAPEIADMPLSLYAGGIRMTALPGAKTAATLFRPYYNRHWDGEYAFFYNPPDRDTGEPALTFNGRVAHFSHNIFSGYHERGAIDLRTMLKLALDRLLPEPMLRTENLPSFARATVTEQSFPARRMAHILTYVPERRGQTDIIEDAVAALDVKVALRLDGKPVTKVYLAPERAPLAFEIKDGYATVNLPAVRGYALVVFES